jgi:hypothetical protein
MRSILFTLVAVACFACTSKVEGSLEVDGAPFAIDECRSGQALGFNGIQLNGKDGRRVRMLAMADGTTNVALFGKDAAVGDQLGQCGTLAVKAQNSRINSINNLEGSAHLDCAAFGHSVVGKIKFENCH